MPVELNNDGQNWLIWAYSQDMKRIVELGRVYNIHADGLIVVITAQFSACIGDGSRVRTILAIVTGNSKKLFSTIIVNFQYFFHFFIWVLVAICFAVSKKSGQWTVDCGLRIRDRGLGIKHGQGIKWGLRFFLFIYFRKLQAFAMDLWPVDLCEFITELKLPEVQTHWHLQWVFKVKTL